MTSRTTDSDFFSAISRFLCYLLNLAKVSLKIQSILVHITLTPNTLEILVLYWTKE